jgi:hypothetical protein
LASTGKTTVAPPTAWPTKENRGVRIASALAPSVGVKSKASMVRETESDA